MNLHEMTYNLLPKRAKAARFAMMPHLTKHEKLKVWLRRWPEQLMKPKDLNDIEWFIDNHCNIGQPPKQAPHAGYIIIPPRKLSPNDRWTPPWADEEVDAYYWMLEKEQQQLLFEHFNPEIWIPIGFARHAKQHQYWIYGKTDTFKSHIFRFARDVGKFGVYFYKFPDAGNHIETEDDWRDDISIFQLGIWPEFNGHKAPADINRFMEGEVRSWHEVNLLA
jgi:hypothetical protein